MGTFEAVPRPADTAARADPLEAEADRLAGRFTPGAAGTPPATSPGTAPAPPSSRSGGMAGGRPLDGATAAAMRSYLGHDFSQVRIHADDDAARSAQALGARAYTIGPDVVLGAGQYAPGTLRGQRLLVHELSHVAQQRAAGPVDGHAVRVTDAGRRRLQGDIPEARLPTTPVETIMGDAQYFENGITSISFYSAELAVLHYDDGSEIRLGLVPEWIEAPFEGVDYRTPRSTHIPVSPAAPSLGTGSVRFLPRGAELRDVPPGVTLADIMGSDELTRTIRFTHHTNGRIVPTEVNTLTAPRLCAALRDAEAQYVQQVDAMAAGAVEVLEKLEWIVILSSLAGGLGGLGGRAAGGRAAGGRAGGRAAGAAVGVAGRAQRALTRVFTRLLRTGGTEAVTVEGVGFGGVRAAVQGTELVVTRGTIVNSSRIPAQGRLIHSAFEQAAIQTARQAGLRTARVAMETVVNPRWAAYLESHGYTFQVVANSRGGFTKVLTKAFTL